MPAQVVSHFTTPDGRPFEVEWDDPAHADELFASNDSHYAEPLSPLGTWIMLHPPGRLRAYAEAGVDAMHMFRGFEGPNGFQYARQNPLSGEELASFITKSRARAAMHGGACNVWPEYSLPRIEEACAWMKNAPVDTPVPDLAAAWNYAFHLTHVAGPTVLFPLTVRLAELLTAYFAPQEAALLAQEVGHGEDNATVASNRALSGLAELAQSNAALATAIGGGRMLHRGELPAATEFFDELETYFETYGDRATAWGIEQPTMRENPAFVWGMIRAAMSSPESHSASGNAATREAALSRVRERLAADAPALAMAIALADELKGYVAVREGRALWQQISAGVLRTKLLEKGDVLVERGAIAQREDILFLLPNEIDPLFEQDAFADCRAHVDERRSIRESWLGVAPPRFITGDPGLLPGAPPPAASNVIIGVPGSRGRVTAPARIVRDLDDADALEEGEVLVCTMTSPPWTPLFGIASAIVTDSGVALSHPAIAAREYGIPAVVGAYTATKRIRTGDTITVDGDAGTVTIETGQ